jgi:UDP-glucose 4-epimerase
MNLTFVQIQLIFRSHPTIPVKEIFEKFKKYFNYKWNVPLFKKRRKGDIDKLICNNKAAHNIINWKPTYSYLSKIIDDEKRWINYMEKKNFFRKILDTSKL